MNSILDPHAADLLLRARQGYTQRMLQLYLRRSKSIRITQPSLSRWLSQHAAGLSITLPPDSEYRHYLEQARLGLRHREYRRALSKWRGHIEHLRRNGASLTEIQVELERRGVTTSIRSIRRELGDQ